jgi:hypothetical protein
MRSARAGRSLNATVPLQGLRPVGERIDDVAVAKEHDRASPLTRITPSTLLPANLCSRNRNKILPLLIVLSDPSAKAARPSPHGVDPNRRVAATQRHTRQTSRRRGGYRFSTICPASRTSTVVLSACCNERSIAVNYGTPWYRPSAGQRASPGTVGRFPSSRRGVRFPVTAPA